MSRGVRNSRYKGRTSNRVNSFVNQRKQAGKEKKWEREVFNNAEEAAKFMFDPKGDKSCK